MRSLLGLARCRCRCPRPGSAAGRRAGAAPTSTPPSVGVADRVGDQVAHDALDQHRVGMHDVADAAAQAQRQALLERGRLEVQRACLREQLVELEVAAAAASTPPVSILVMSSSSENRPSSASTELLMLLTSCVDLSSSRLLRAAPRRTGPSRAAAGAGRGWRRRRTASWRGWRARPRGAPPRRPPSRRAAGRPAARCAPSARPARRTSRGSCGRARTVIARISTSTSGQLASASGRRPCTHARSSAPGSGR